MAPRLTAQAQYVGTGHVVDADQHLAKYTPHTPTCAHAHICVHRTQPTHPHILKSLTRRLLKARRFYGQPGLRDAWHARRVAAAVAARQTEKIKIKSSEKRKKEETKKRKKRENVEKRGKKRKKGEKEKRRSKERERV